MTSQTNDHYRGKTRIIACGMIAREVLAVNEQLGFEHIDLKCLPAEYHHHPEKIAPEMDKAITKARSEGYENIIVGYADCGTGGELDKVCEKHGVERLAGPHCFSFYIGNEEFAKSDDEHMTTFFITDFLARHFDTFLKKPLGLDKHPELVAMYFSNYSKALYIAQSKDPALEENARQAAEFMGLEYAYQFTGFGDLHTEIEKFGSSHFNNEPAK